MAFKVDAQGAIVAGKTISEWTQDWWKWIVTGPLDPFNPSDDTTGALSYLNNGNPVFFLAGGNPITGTHVSETRYIVVPHDKPILVPVLNLLDFEGPGITPADNTIPLNDLVNQTLAAALPTLNKSSLNVVIDGKSLEGLPNHLETTDFFSMGVVKPGSLLTSKDIGIKPGSVMTTDKAAGYWVMLEGLSKGVHTVSFGGTTTTGFSTQTTDHLIVV
jgi:hypothetical protein